MGPGNQPSLFGPARSGPAIDDEDRYAVSEGDALFETRTKIYTLGMDWDIADHTLSFIAGHQENLLKQQRDYDPTNSVPGYMPMQVVHTPYKLWTGELRFASNMNDFWNYTFGVFYQDAENPVTVTQPSFSFFANDVPATPFPTELGLFLPIYTALDIPVSIRNRAVFTAQSFQFTDELKLEVGLRYAEIDTSQQSTLSVTSPGNPALFVPPFGLGPIDTIEPKASQRTERPLTGGASLSYQFDVDTNLYMSYGHSFRPGTAAVGYTVQLDQELLLIDPEKSDSIEFGVKSNLLDGRLKFNAALFYQKFEGYISQSEANIVYASAANGIPDGIGLFNFGGDATSQGIEIQTEALLTDNWVAGLNASYVEAKYDDAEAPCNDFNGDGEPDAEGSAFVPVGQQVSFCTLDGRIAEVPSFNLSLTSEYSVPLGAVEPFVRGVLTYRPGFSSERANYEYDSFTLLNVFFGIRDPDNRWEVSLFAKNLLDQEKISNISIGTGQTSTSTFAGTAGAPFDSGYRQINLTLPREIGLSTRYSF
jgi:iron complex outermembrane receptor protein